MSFTLLPLAAPVLKMAAALLLDHLLGEARRWHPLVGFGRYASFLEARIHALHPSRAGGLLAWLLAVLPWLGLALWLRGHGPVAQWLVDIALLYFAVGGRSLREHGSRVADALEREDLPEARRAVGMMVSRDTTVLDQAGVARAATESVLENGNDAVFGALFWFLLLGGPGALLFRLANTLDAMWGYRTPRLILFGWGAARIDDALNWLPARLTALTYALLGNTSLALACWKTQAPAWDSPNAGPVMSAGAGALQVELGGAAIYHGRSEIRPALGHGNPPGAHHVRGALHLVGQGSLLWLTVAALLALLAGAPGA